MPNQTIAIGADHGGYEAKAKLAPHLKTLGYRVIDVGTNSAEPADYPIYGFRVAEAVGHGHAQLGVLLCRSGNGMAIAANKVHGVRAALASNRKLAELARQHNDANVIIMGADHMEDPCEAVLDAFLNAKPEGERHARRVAIINAYDKLLASTLPTYQLVAAGQSPWLDDISDEFISSGNLKRMVDEECLRGVTSNPTIFEKAIGSGKGRYPGALAEMKKQGVSADEAYLKITSHDIIAAADVLRPVYDATGGDDGYVSWEELPSSAYEEEISFNEGLKLFEMVDRPNVMIKVPGTKEGIRAFRRLIAEGVNINVTLIFSREFYREIARAYIAGLKDRLAKGLDVSRVRSVASVFVSRIDTAVDKLLADKKDNAAAQALLHQIAIANTKMIYQDFKSIFYGEEFAELAAAGAAVQRPLWGSTGTKDPSLSDVLYVETLVGPQTVNTIPLKTLQAFIDHGHVRPNSVEEDLDGARASLANLAKVGIDIEKVCMDLQSAGVKSFADSFDSLFAVIKKGLA